jgi:transposase
MTATSSTVETDIIIGVDTHKNTHAAVAIDRLGRQLEHRSVATTKSGLIELLNWAQHLGRVRAWGIEGTGSYGAGLARHLLAAGETVHEVSRPDRRVRRDHGKSDPLDAEIAARSVLARRDLGSPKGDGSSEALRQLRATRRAAMKARTQAANQLHALLLTGPQDLRAELDTVAFVAKVQRCAKLRPGTGILDAREACKLSLRSVARRWQHLTAEIAELDTVIAAITTAVAPVLLAQFGVGPDVAAALLITAGGNKDRMRRESSFAALCGVNPLPASSGKTNRHRLNRGGDRQANSALHTVALTRMRSDPRTRAYVAKRTAQGLSKREIMRCLKRYIARDLYPLILLSQSG